MKTNVLIIGSGGREHAIAWKINQSKLLNKLYVAPGNSGTSQIAKNLTINTNDYTELKQSILEKKIDLLIIGPEAPLVAGLHDKLSSDLDLENLKIIGPKKAGAKLEGSKLFAKKFMQKYEIPTADFKSFDSQNISQAKDYLQEISPPYVIKADGLAAGKGVFICNNIKNAVEVIDEIIVNRKFGEAGNNIVIEQFLDGVELSVFILTDGKSYHILPTAKDYKRIGENDTGLNTGGMGAISPVPFIDENLMNKIKSKIIEPTLLGLKKEHIEYTGFIFFGLIKVNDEPFVIEYNVRLGDPETQAIMPRIESDFLDLLLKTYSHTLFADAELNISANSAATIIIASGGYPEKYEVNCHVEGLEKIQNSIIYHAGLKLVDNKLVTNGGRVLAVTSCSDTLKNAVKEGYKDVKNIKFENLYLRKDIGRDVIK